MIVLDTHVIIWDALAPERLSNSARQAIDEANREEGIFVSDISLWEIAMLIEKRRVAVKIGCQDFITLVLQANRTTVKAITPQIATLAVQLPAEINRDPVDRLIVATAVAENASLITADRNLQTSTLLTTIW